MALVSVDSRSGSPTVGSSPPLPRELWTLPSEIRLQIYSHIFIRDDDLYISDQDQSSYPYRKCGQGLSATSQMFCRETRHLYYRCAEFSFCSPLMCRRFLDVIGFHGSNIRTLCIAFGYADAHLLQPIFRTASRIQTLVLAYTDHYDLNPIYLPSVRNTDTSIEYDIRFRPESHSLSTLNSIRKLTVRGHVETQEIQEAIVKLVLKMMDVACREGKLVIETETLDVQLRRQVMVRYQIQIQD